MVPGNRLQVGKAGRYLHHHRRHRFLKSSEFQGEEFVNIYHIYI